MKPSMFGSVAKILANGFKSLRSCMLSHFSHIRLCVKQQTVACQAPLSMEFSRPEYWSCHALLQGIFMTQGLNPHDLCLLYWHISTLLVPPGMTFKPLGRGEKNSLGVI